jgi:subtilisin-like proprotein convertase family protein
MACGDTLTGTSTGNLTSGGGLSTIDYWKITTPTTTPGIYKYTLTLNSPTPGHSTAIRGLTQSGGVINTSSDVPFQGGLVSGSDRINTFYGFGNAGRVVYSVTGTSATTQPYTVTLGCSVVPVIDVVGNIFAGQVTIGPDSATIASGVDLDWWLYDSSFNPVPSGGRDSPDSPGPTLTLPPGTYYLAYGVYNTANNQPAAVSTGETWLSGSVLEFPGVLATSQVNSATTPFNVNVVSAAGTATGTATRPPTQEVVWYRLNITPANVPIATAAFSPTPVGVGGSTTLTLTITPAGGSTLNNITSVTADVSQVSGVPSQTSVPLTRIGSTNQWSYTIPAANGTPGTRTVTYRVTDSGATGGQGTGSISISIVVGNDGCTTADAISVGQTIVADNTASTNENPVPPTCATLSTFNNGLWYRFTEGATGRRLVASTCDAQTAFNTRVYVYSGSCAALTCVNANATATPACGARADAATVTFCTTPGQTYYILVTNDTSGTGVFALSLTDTGLGCNPPANDTCAGATNIALSPFTPVPFAADNTFGATTDNIDIGTCNTTSVATNGVWFTFVAPSNGVVQFAETSAQDVATGVWEFAPGSVACPTTGPANLLCNAAESFNFNVVGGRTYILLVHTDSTVPPTVGIQGTLTFLPAPANEDCASAAPVPGPGTYVISNIGANATPSGNSPQPCPTASTAFNSDVWFRWTATSDGPVAIAPRSIPAAFAGALAYYDGGGAPSSCPGPSDAAAACGTFGATFVNNPTPTLNVSRGRVYFLQVGSTGTTTGTANIDFDFSPSSLGRCCSGASCTVATPGECTALGGTYGGDGTVCSTATSTTSSYTGAGGAVPDGATGTPGTEGVFASSLSVSDTFTIADAEVDIVWSVGHTYVNDLIITLSNGTRTIPLINRPRRGQNTFGGGAADFIAGQTYTFSDAGSQTLEDFLVTAVTTIPGGVYRPGGVLGLGRGLKATFNGLPAGGTWTLRILDHAGADTGTVASWTLRLTQGGPSACGPSTVLCCRGSACNVVASGACTLAPGTGAGLVNAGPGSACNASNNDRQPCCKADYNKLGGIELLDIFAFLTDWFNNVPYTDFTGQSGVDLLDIFAFLTAWFAGGC